eukprot:2135916-Rhodomonas_salina.1
MLLPAQRPPRQASAGTPGELRYAVRLWGYASAMPYTGTITAIVLDIRYAMSSTDNDIGCAVTRRFATLDGRH